MSDDTRLSECGTMPNCVSSDSTAFLNRIKPFVLTAHAPQAWSMVVTVVRNLKNAHITEEQDAYLRAECRIPVFGFIDDLELELRESENLVAVRSASRVGRFDLFINRLRVERLRSALRSQGVVK